MKSPRRRPKTVTIIPERKHARPAGTRLITRSTTVRPFVYSLPGSKHSEEPVSADTKGTKEDTSKDNNTTVISSDQKLANKTQTAISSYSSTPSIYPRKRSSINRTLLKSFDSLQDAPEKDVQNKDLHQKPLNDLLQELAVNEKLKSSKITPQKTLQEELLINRRHNLARSTKTSHEGSQIRQSTRILALNKKVSKQSHVIPPLESLSSEKEKSKHSADTSVSGASLKVTRTSVGSKIKSTGSPVVQSSPQLPSVVKTTSSDGNSLVNQKFGGNLKCKNDSEKLSKITIEHTVFTKDLTVQTPQKALHPVSKTSTPIKLSSIDEANKNLVQISEIIPDEVSAVVVEENNHLADASVINKKSHNNAAPSAVVDNIYTQENIQDTFSESCQDIKLRKCIVVLHNLKCLMQGNIKETLIEKQQREDQEIVNEHLEVENAKDVKEQEKIVADEKCLINVNNDDKEEEVAKPVASFSHPPVESNISLSKSQSEPVEKTTLTSLPATATTPSQSIYTNKDIGQEELLLVSSVAAFEPPVTHVPIEHRTSNINNALTKQISGLSQPSSVHKPPTANKVTSKSNLQPQNAVSDNNDPGHLAFEHTEPVVPQKRLKLTSNKELNYNAIVRNIKRSAPRQPTKRKRKTKPDSSVNHLPDKHPLFEEHKKIMFWTGEKGARKISDLSDLDVALNAIDQVVEEISEEDQKKKQLLQQVQGKYRYSIRRMIKNSQFIKKKKKEIKELMTTVKELAKELDLVVDRKVRLHSELLDLKTRMKTSKITSGPTWEDFASNF